MLKKHMAACLIATAFVAAPALAQGTSTTSSDRPAASDNRTGTLGSPAMNAPGGASTAAGAGMGSSGTTASGMAGSSGTNMSGSTAPSSTGTAGSAGAGTTAASGTSQPTVNPAQFVERQEQGQVLASKLIGTNVIGQNNESIGDINDVVMDQSGKAIAAVIGVGGFLGIGEKDVAVRFEELKLMRGNQQNAANTTGSTSGATTGSTGATTGSTGGATTGSTAGNASGGGNSQEIDRVMLSMTKDQLRNAPTFRAMGDRETTTGTTGNQGNTTAPAANRP